MRVLLLGGTAEARSLADALVRDGVDVVSSLAGRVSRPRLPAGAVRVGGFGGVAGLRQALDGYDVVVDATHPFAATISGSAAQACEEASVPLLRLARPGWSSLEGAARWHWVASHEDAASVAQRLGGPVLLTTGRQSLHRFVPSLGASSVLARVVDPVDVPLPETWSVLLARGPYTLEAELALMRDHRASVLVTKDSGGELTRAKLDAADALGVDVVVVRRPVGPAGVQEVTDVAGAVRWLAARPPRSP
jgi:precorrin-6A/cobalt-precorrin-6A reductase